MQNYIGYGFDTNDISDETWYILVSKYDSEEISNEISITEDDKIQDALEFIDGSNISRCEYLRNIINSEESEKAGTDYIVTDYDNYLVFNSIRFADDSKRTEYIRNADEFIAMVGRYIPTENLHFGNLYEGTDWMDPSYWME